MDQTNDDDWNSQQWHWSDVYV